MLRSMNKIFVNIYQRIIIYTISMILLKKNNYDIVYMELFVLVEK
jgi:hypothetical protein